MSLTGKYILTHMWEKWFGFVNWARFLDINKDVSIISLTVLKLKLNQEKKRKKSKSRERRSDQDKEFCIVLLPVHDSIFRIPLLLSSLSYLFSSSCCCLRLVVVVFSLSCC